MSTETTAGTGSALSRLLAVGWVPYLVLALFAGGYTAVAQTGTSSAFSQFDEYQYFDYLTKVPHQGFVRQGEETSQETRRRSSCEGIQFFGPVGVGCDVSPQEPKEAFPVGGHNSADIYTPLYFAPTRVLAQPFLWLGLDLLEAGRAVGGLWLFLGLAGIFAVQRRLRVDPAVALGVALVVVALPSTFWATQFISTDAPTYLVVSLIALAGLRFAAGDGRAWELPAASALAVGMKVNNIAGLGLTLIALLLFVISSRRSGDVPARLPTTARTVVVSVVSVVSAVGVYAVWLAIRAGTAISVHSADIDQFNKQPFRWRLLADEALRFAPDVGRVVLPRQPDWWPALVETVFPLVGVGALAIALVATGTMWRARRSIAVGVLLTLLLFGPLLVLMMVIVSGSYVELTVRYGIVFVVPYAVLIGLVGHQVRLRGGVVLGIGVVAAALTLVV